ncbi:hypothetical protein RND81_09G038700 [Saponaria officinalis]|uniref:Retrovirus-related Pol polyprotein from transposon TNT 1-94-like beta-barrel domain-containing protein n=1 Tax=Saponaria officinalis TaxID=3572 RepID=A0AAW1II41_SAPOF
MINSRDLFVNAQALSKQIMVGLPDGTTKLVTYIGEVTIHSDIILHDVLYIPDFKHNLLSVGKLLAQNYVLTHFDVDQCFIQDHARSILLFGYKKRGLYKLIHAYCRSLCRSEFFNKPVFLGTSSSLQCDIADRCKVHSHIELLH